MNILLTIITTVLGVAVSPAIALAADDQGTTLPRPEQPFRGKIERLAKDSTPDFPKGIEAPKGAPNILLILTDDVGFWAPLARSAVRSRRRRSIALQKVACGTRCSTRPRFVRRRAPR